MNKNTTHGMTGTKFYGVWNSMKNRCLNTNTKSYAHYGARGITVDSRWRSFKDFYDDMHKPYSDHYKIHGSDTTLERIDNTKGYSKDNCRWATRLEQASNTTQMRLVTINGETNVVSEWCRKLKIHDSVVYRRVKSGMTIEDALTAPRQRGHLITLGDATLNVAQWTEKMGLNETTIFDRLKHGWTEHDAVMTPVGGKRTSGNRAGEPK